MEAREINGLLKPEIPNIRFNKEGLRPTVNLRVTFERQ